MRPHRVPDNWTAEQAFAVVDWMQGFVDAVWEQYGDELLELMASHLPNPVDDVQLDLPF